MIPKTDAETARLLGMKVDELRARRDKPREPMRGQEYEAASGRKFNARIQADSDDASSVARGVQLLLDLHETSGRVARRRKDRDRGVVLAELERRGELAIEELGEAPPKRACSAWLVYQSMGGEMLATELRGLTFAEAEYVRSMSRDEYPGNRRVVVWPSQSTAPIMHLEHADDHAKDA